MRPDFNSMSGPELIKAHNDMAIVAAAKSIPASATKRFSNLEAGVRRCEALYEAINSKPEEVPPETKEEDMPKKATVKKAFKKTAVRKEGKPPHSAIAIACGVKSTNRRAVLDCLNLALGKQRGFATVKKAVYGEGFEKISDGAFRTVIRALEIDLKCAKACKYNLKIEKEESGAVTYGLYEK